ncbi:MAG: biopolymer transporter ExbD [Deltaproteobacteria bacterium]|nr:biopolymer transporter ExbD [Deltaproteobacteria bacterium]
MNLHTALSKVRAKIRRETARIEEAAHEGGEINLVPYLDIVTNTVIFMLATAAGAVALANINVSAPRYSTPSAAAASATPDKPSEKKLNLTIVVSNKGFIVAGAGGVIDAKAAQDDLRKAYPSDAYVSKRLASPATEGELPTIRCKTTLRADRCPAFLTKRHNAKLEIDEMVWIDRYDHRLLVKMLKMIKKQFSHERQVIISADRNIPYQVVVRTMDHVRGKSTVKCTGDDGCLFDEIVLSAGVQ